MEDLEVLETLEALAGRKLKTKMLPRRKSITISTMNSSGLPSQPPPNKSERHSERKLLKSILTKEEILISSNNSQMLIKFSLTQKRDNFMMIMERKESRMVVHLEVEEWEVFLICSLEEERNNLVQEKANQN